MHSHCCTQKTCGHLSHWKHEPQRHRRCSVPKIVFSKLWHVNDAVVENNETWHNEMNQRFISSISIHDSSFFQWNCSHASCHLIDFTLFYFFQVKNHFSTHPDALVFGCLIKIYWLMFTSHFRSMMRGGENILWINNFSNDLLELFLLLVSDRKCNREKIVRYKIGKILLMKWF